MIVRLIVMTMTMVACCQYGFDNDDDDDDDTGDVMSGDDNRELKK